MVMMRVGMEAPDFELPDLNGNAVRLSGFRNKKNILLVFNRGFL
jgi:peroxiredoxin